MSEVVYIRIALRPGSLQLVREWSRALNDDRRNEALAAMEREGVTVESYFLDRRPEGDYLIAYMRAESVTRASELASNSQLDIDLYHNQVKETAWGERAVLEPLVDLVTDAL